MGIVLNVAAVRAHVAVRVERAGLGRAAVLVAVVTAAEGEAIVVTVRHGGLRFQPGQVSLPGGKLEAGETDLLACALREAEEEVGLTARDVEVVGELDEVVVAQRFAVTPFVGRVRAGVELVRGETEVARVVAVPVAVLAEAGRWRVIEVPRADGTVRRAYEVRVPDGAGAEGELRIWGATARMLKNALAVGYGVVFGGLQEL